MEKKPFVTKEQLDKIVEKYPTPFHLYDEKGIRQTARDLYKAFSWNEGFKEYFAVKATPTPAILKILKEEGCGTDCSSLTELMMSDRCGFADGDSIMFSSNETPAEEFVLAKKLGAIIYRTKKFENLSGSADCEGDADGQLRLITDSNYALTGELQDKETSTCLYSANPNLVRLLKDALANEIRLIEIEKKDASI